MDDFLIVLGIAVAVLLIAGLAFSNLPITPSQMALENKSVYSFVFGEIGYNEPVVSKEIRITDLVVGTPQDVSLFSVDKKAVSASYFGSEELSSDIDIESSVLNSLESVNVVFDVGETNKYADLVVAWNGEEIERGSFQGPVEVKIPKNKIKDKNKLRVHTGPPGIQFWASTVYEIRDFLVEGEYGQITPISFEIEAREIETFDRADLVLESIDGQGEKLIIKLNGEEVYNKFPPSTDKIVINSGLLLGKNILSFSSVGGIFEVTGKLKINVLTKETISERKFYLSQEDFDLLKQETKLNINIRRVDKPGDLVIKVNGNQIQKRPSDGTNIIHFDKSFLKVGDNVLQFTATGRFDIGTVSLER